ncbi:MAG: peptidoglycan DD-metalloendopeptidase family protein [Actinomycetota bacterium]|nr:peptidoglycan DD-metalloendopeptidase family protein [Actinomycetota bacterium]
MRSRFVLALLCALALAAPALAEDSPSKASVDARIAALNAKIAKAHEAEGILSHQISRVTSQIRTLEGQVDSASSRLSVLETNLSLHQRKLDTLTRLFELETRRLVFLRRQYAEAQARLNDRLVSIYESDNPDTLAVVLSSSSFADLLDQLDYLSQIAAQDNRIAREVERARNEMHRTRERTRKTRHGVAVETRAIATRTAEQRSVRDRLVASELSLADARAEKNRRLAGVRESKAEYLHEVAGLQAQSAALGAHIRSTQTSAPADSTPSSSGLVWPVSGPVTSGFGWRWGRMHEGIDIAAASGTPIHASAGGTVIYAGWLSGYGNLVVIDHHNTLATAYAHQSSMASGVGASVAQGQVIGYVGCTGHCFGPHLHFEVRINGGAVDPLGYL